jgi:hypothetical protein
MASHHNADDSSTSLKGHILRIYNNIAPSHNTNIHFMDCPAYGNIKTDGSNRSEIYLGSLIGLNSDGDIVRKAVFEKRKVPQAHN